MVTKKTLGLMGSLLLSGALYGGHSLSRERTRSTREEHVAASLPCYLAQLPLPIANKIGALCRDDDFVDSRTLAKQKTERKGYSLRWKRNRSLSYKDPNLSRLAAFFTQSVPVVKEPWLPLGLTYQYDTVKKFNIVDGNAVLLYKVKSSGRCYRHVELHVAQLNMTITPQEIVTLPSGRPSQLKKFTVWPFTISMNGKDVFYIRTINNRAPTLIHQRKKDGDERKRGKWPIQQKIRLPRAKYREMVYFEKTNRVGLLKADGSIDFIALDDKKSDSSVAERVEEKPELLEHNLLEQYLRERGVCKSLAASLPVHEAEDFDLE